MLSLDPKDLYKEIKSAVDKRNLALSTYDEQIKSYHGAAYEGEKSGVKESSYNHASIWLSSMLPSLVFRNPRVRVKTRKAVGMEQSQIEEAGVATQAFLNTWVKQQGFADKLRKCAVEFSFKFCFGMVTRRKHPGDPSIDTETERYLPEFQRLPIERIVLDPYCDDIKDSRYRGHVWYADKDDLLKQARAEIEEFGEEDAGWNLKGIESLESGTGMDDGAFHDRADVASDRDEVYLIDLWIPESDPDSDLGPEEGYHGQIMTLGYNGNESEAFFIRKPRPCYCPPCGPYAMRGYLDIPKHVYPSGPLTVSWGQEKMVQNMVDHANKSSAQYRKCWLVPAGGHDEDALITAMGANDVVIPVAGLSANTKPIQIEIGGVTDQQLRNIQFSLDQLERLTGLDAAAGGDVQGDSTATENAIADQARQTIRSHIVESFQLFAADILRKAAWYGFADEEVRMEIDEEVPGYEGVESATFVGGPGDLPLSAFESLAIDIEPMSMARENEAMSQRRSLQAVELSTQLATIARQFPEIDIELLQSQIADSMNMPGLDGVLDVQMSRQLMGVPADPGSIGGGGKSSAIHDGFGPERRETPGRLMAGILGQVSGVA